VLGAACDLPGWKSLRGWHRQASCRRLLVVSPKFAQVRAVALELTEEERIRLAEDLYESVEESDGTPHGGIFSRRLCGIPCPDPFNF
jgi:hypothetical protein